jgi:predicted Zn-dependent peptidase
VRTKRKVAVPAYQPLEEKQGSQKMLVKYRDVGQVQIAFGTKAYPYEHKLLPALNLLSVILGENMSSRLFIRVRERRGLCYHIHTGISVYEDTGAFAVQSGLDRRRLPVALQAIMAELADVKKHGVKSEELAKAKEFIKGKLTLEWEDSENIADWFARQQLLIGKMKTPEQRLKQIFDVENDDIKQVANELFNTNNFRGVLIGPVKDGKALEKLITL